jgi:hypothetical protein
MSRYAWGFLMCIFALFSWRAIAQPTDIPSDFELKVAYCVAYYHETLSNYPRISPDLDRAGIDDTTRRLNRLRAYLVARGFLSQGARGSHASRGIFIALERGTSDYKSCMAKISDCVKTCPLCDIGCWRNDPACTATAACENVDPPL